MKSRANAVPAEKLDAGGLRASALSEEESALQLESAVTEGWKGVKGDVAPVERQLVVVSWLGPVWHDLWFPFRPFQWFPFPSWLVLPWLYALSPP